MSQNKFRNNKYVKMVKSFFTKGSLAAEEKSQVELSLVINVIVLIMLVGTTITFFTIRKINSNNQQKQAIEQKIINNQSLDNDDIEDKADFNELTNELCFRYSYTCFNYPKTWTIEENETIENPSILLMNPARDFGLRFVRVDAVKRTCSTQRKRKLNLENFSTKKLKIKSSEPKTTIWLKSMIVSQRVTDIDSPNQSGSGSNSHSDFFANLEPAVYAAVTDLYTIDADNEPYTKVGKYKVFDCQLENSVVIRDFSGIEIPLKIDIFDGREAIEKYFMSDEVKVSSYQKRTYLYNEPSLFESRQEALDFLKTPNMKMYYNILSSFHYKK